MTWAAILVDARPLRENPAFRRLWVGNLVSGFGSQMGSFTISWVIWERTHSAGAVGFIGLSMLISTLAFTMLGGHWSDRFDRRVLLIVIRWVQLATAAAMTAVVILLPHAVWPFYPLVFVEMGTIAIGNPATTAYLPGMLDGDRLPAAMALTQTSFQLNQLLGPLAAGVILAGWGPGWTLVLDTLSFAAAVYGVAGLPRLPRPARSDAEPTPWQNILEGVRFVTRRPLILGLLLGDVNAMVLSMPTALFPVLNSERWGGSPVTLGLLTPAMGLGGVLAGFLSGRITSASRQGVIMIVASELWGAAIGAAGLVAWLPGVLVLLMVAGAADVASVVCRTTIIQAVTPDELRGRVNSLDFLAAAGGPNLGNVRAGLVADVTSGAFSMFIGGALSAVVALGIAAAIPALRDYRARQEDPVR